MSDIIIHYITILYSLIQTIHIQNFKPDRSRPGLTTTAISIGANQDGSVKLATGRAKQLTNKIQLPKTIITIRTWNVRTLRRYGKIHELTNDLIVINGT